MHLLTLLRSFDPAIDLSGVGDVEIRGVCDDSRRARPGDLFVVRSARSEEARRFAADAVARGAVAVVTPARIDGLSAPQARCADPHAAARLAHRFHGDPSRGLRVAAVTGTNGKTTTAHLLRQILSASGVRCGLIGTVEIDDGAAAREAELTTPGAVELAGLFAAMRGSGCGACAMEASSHALHQGRLVGTRLVAAGFTNLTGDHLDYHGSMDAYADAKATLFDGLPKGAVAAVNAGSPYADRMTRDTPARVVRFAVEAPAAWQARQIIAASTGTRFALESPLGAAAVSLRLIGRHNVENALCAASIAAEAYGVSLPAIVDALASASGAPGRLQRVDAGQPFSVLVDYAHTDDALANVLRALRPLTSGRLRVLFGCGGDRDRTKRPRMARTAAELADEIYLTSDNPRTENPLAIIGEARTGFPADTVPRVRVEPDRRVAIASIIADAQSGDVVLIAGKGHETYQIIGTEKTHFDDVEEAEQAIRALHRKRQAG